ncbi:MAG: LysM peptidoglycan-binding domain-containing protein [Hyphomonadaceae bacterium]
MRPFFRLIVAAFAASVAGACSHLPPLAGMSETAPVSAAGPREHVRAAVDLLGRGEESQARAELRAALEARPGNATAQRLLQQLDADPRTLLPGAPRPYMVRPGETMSQLAERFFGDGLLFYALARYNEIDAPNQLAAGQILMIPRRPGQPAEEAALDDVAPLEQRAPDAAAPPRSIDASRASQLRLQALQQLNSGRVDSAVALLRQARSLDTGNAAIQRDLDRAVRLQGSLRSRSG